ncbi:hypothetical protein CC2G_001997 [Coprinopsis cinerea AmutBmut pab1-1]|nr:hypothetical protein CC2G_001997 [Coprinopsis cinerea AmutBmut pab1-1]
MTLQTAASTESTLNYCGLIHLSGPHYLPSTPVTISVDSTSHPWILFARPASGDPLSPGITHSASQSDILAL